MHWIMKNRSTDIKSLNPQQGTGLWNTPTFAPLLLCFLSQWLFEQQIAFLLMIMQFTQLTFPWVCILWQLCISNMASSTRFVSKSHPFFEPTNHISCWCVPNNCDQTTIKTLFSPIDFECYTFWWHLVHCVNKILHNFGKAMPFQVFWLCNGINIYSRQLRSISRWNVQKGNVYHCHFMLPNTGSQWVDNFYVI